MCFSLMPCPERKEIRDLIENAGGVLLQPDRMPDAIRLVPSFITTTTDSSDDVFSVNYIRACCENNKLYSLKDFKLPTSPMVPDDCDRKERTLRSVRTRREYTLGEDIAIAKFIAKQPGARIKGNEVYKEMVAAGIVPGKHSWQSLKQRYLKTIRPFRQLYESPDAASSLRNRFSRERVKARDSSEQNVLVEDSGSEDNSSRKRKVQVAPELERSEGTTTEAEVVAETESQTASPSEEFETPARKRGFYKADEKRKHRSRRDRDSSSVSPAACGCQGATTPRGSPRKVPEQKAAKEGDEVKRASRQQDPGEVLTEKLKLRTSLRRAQERMPNRSSNDRAQALSRPGIDSGDVARTVDPETVVGPSPVRSSKQKTSPTPAKTSRKVVLASSAGHPSARAHAESGDIESDGDFEVSPGLDSKQRTHQPSTTTSTRHKRGAHRSDHSRKRSSRRSSRHRPERTPSPGSTRQPTRSSSRKRGRPEPPEKSVDQSSTQLHPKSRTDNDGAPKTDSENPPGPTCVPQEANLRIASSLGGRKNKGVPPPCKSCDEHMLPSEVQMVLPKGKRNSSRLRMQKKPVTSAKGSDEVPNVDSSATSVPNSGCVPDHQLSPPSRRERRRGTPPSDPGGRSSTPSLLESDHSDGMAPETDLKDPLEHARASEGSKSQTTSLPKRATGSPGRESEREQARTEEREAVISMGTRTPSPIRKRNEPPSPAKGSDKVPDIVSSGTSTADSARSPEGMPTQGSKLRHVLLSGRKEVATTSPAKSGSRLSTEPRLESSCNAASETDSEDPLGLSRVVRGSLLGATLPRDRSRAKGSSKWTVRLRKRKSLTQTEASALLRKQQSKPTRLAKESGAESAASDAEKGEDSDVGQLDSADELLLEQVTGQAPESPILLDSADEALLAKVTEPCNDDASTVTLSSEPSVASAIIIQSGSECSEGEDVAPASVQDGFSKERQQLARLLGVLKEGKKVPLHASTPCPLECSCPRSNGYIQAARAAVACAAFLASRDIPLPTECPGAKDPRVILLLEVLLRRLEGGGVDDDASS